MKNNFYYAYLILLIFVFRFNIYSDTTSDNTILGNPDYSKNHLYFKINSFGGLSGTKDFFSEYFESVFLFSSQNKHTFGIRLSHKGFTKGIFTGNFDYFHFSVNFGFQYLYKLFSSYAGIFTFFDIGFCNWGFAINAGFGLGDLYYNGLIISFGYFYNSYFNSLIDFYFTFFKYFALRGNLGIDFEFSEIETFLFNISGGVFAGVAIKSYMKIELGGGFTVNDYSVFRGYAGVHLSINSIF